MTATALAPNPRTSTGLMTVDEFFDYVHRPENERRNLELVRGKVVEMPRPGQPHGLVAANVAFEIKLHARRNRKGVVSVEAGVILELDPDTVRGPDVMYFANHSIQDVGPKWAEIPPDLAVEVLSPNDRPGQVNSKIRDYLDNGVKVVWVIDCEERTVTIHRPNRSFEILDESNELTGGEELPGFTCSVRTLFLDDGEIPA